MSSLVISTATPEQMTAESVIAAAASSAAVGLAAPQLFAGAMALGAGAATGGILAVAGYGSFIAIRQLHQDYQQAQAEYQARSAEQVAYAQAYQQQAASAAADAAEISGQITTAISESAIAQYLQQNLLRLAQRIPLLPVPDPQLAGQCAALLQRLEEHAEELPALLEQYFQLSQRMQKAAMKAAGLAGSNEVLREELASLRTTLDGALFATGPAVREDCLAQLSVLEALLHRQPKIVKQGIEMLAARVQREIQQLAAREEEAQAQRALVGETLARLQALTRMQVLPEERAAAVALLATLSETLAREGDETPALPQLAGEAQALFSRCEQLLAEETLSRYLREEVTEVLLTMGYQVTQAQEGSAGVLAAVGNDVGIEFHIDGKGALVTKMVALSKEAADSGQTEQARVCALVDQVFAALQARKCDIRERYRLSLDKDEQLRVVTPTPAVEAPGYRDEAKRMMKE